MSEDHKLQRPFRADYLSRRDFMAQTTAIGAAATLGTGLLGRPAQASPQQGGHFKLGIGSGSTTDTLDPAHIESTWNQNFCFGTLRNALTNVEPSGDLGPELAESWEASDDATQWTFNLRKDVTFHSGKTMESEDVIASLRHHMGEDSKSAGKALLADVANMEADGKNRVIITLNGGNADFPFLMSDYHFCILPSKDGHADAHSGDGTGPYVLENFDPGVKGLAKRNPNYFKSGMPYFDSVELIAIQDPVARTNAMTTGEVHIMDRCDLKTVHLLKRHPDVDVTEVTGTLHYTFPMRTDMAPFDNNDVRLALKYAVNREELVAKILRGYGGLGNDHPISTANRYHASNLAQRNYDPDKAKFHLKKAGAEGLRVELSAADAAFAGAVDSAVLMREHAAAAGITIDVVREPNDGYWSNVWMKKAWCACYWSGRPTEDLMFSTEYARGVPWNDSFWDHDLFNELLVQARAELDTTKRRAMYEEMQEIVRDEGGVLIPMFANYVGANSTKLGHATIGSNYDMDGAKVTERWWFV
ncbi:MAG: ABC transporter substrate-binding protein [Pseudomonadota bacterium]